MTGKQAIEALMLGKKVRCSNWVKGAYLYYDKKSLTVKDNNNKTQMSTCFDAFLSNIQWELYEEDKRRNTMTFEEALKAMREGKKVKRAKWRNGNGIWIDKNNGEICTEGKAYERTLSFAEITADDWEVYEEEPKKLIKVFISQPMNGRSKCEITEERNKIKKLVEAKYGEGYQIEYLNEDLWERPKDWTSIQNLGYSIMNMYNADVVVFAPDWIKPRGCCVEYEVAYQYNKKIYTCDTDSNGEYRLY